MNGIDPLGLLAVYYIMLDTDYCFLHMIAYDVFAAKLADDIMKQIAFTEYILDKEESETNIQMHT
ncbi:MAG: hypothetical protein WBQ25_17910 [Nitrososphaeraceae archaeon]